MTIKKYLRVGLLLSLFANVTTCNDIFNGGCGTAEMANQLKAPLELRFTIKAINYNDRGMPIHNINFYKTRGVPNTYSNIAKKANEDITSRTVFKKTTVTLLNIEKVVDINLNIERWTQKLPWVIINNQDEIVDDTRKLYPLPINLDPQNIETIEIRILITNEHLIKDILTAYTQNTGTALIRDIITLLNNNNDVGRYVRIGVHDAHRYGGPIPKVGYETRWLYDGYYRLARAVH